MMRTKKPVDEYTLLRRMMMMRRGLSQRYLAEEWSTSQSFVSQLISGKCRSELHERKFAEIIGLPREQLFEMKNGRAKDDDAPAPRPQIPLPFSDIRARQDAGNGVAEGHEHHYEDRNGTSRYAS
jgi:plasmid maintenance system antidote protein VapI